MCNKSAKAGGGNRYYVTVQDTVSDQITKKAQRAAGLQAVENRFNKLI